MRWECDDRLQRMYRHSCSAGCSRACAFHEIHRYAVSKDAQNAVEGYENTFYVLTAASMWGSEKKIMSDIVPFRPGCAEAKKVDEALFQRVEVDREICRHGRGINTQIRSKTQLLDFIVLSEAPMMLYMLGIIALSGPVLLKVMPKTIWCVFEWNWLGSS